MKANTDWRFLLGHGERDRNTLPYHPDEIAELYLGAKMTAESKAEIVGLAQAVNPHMEVFEMFYVGFASLYPFYKLRALI